jgi:hypothetical protein
MYVYIYIYILVIAQGLFTELKFYLILNQNVCLVPKGVPLRGGKADCLSKTRLMVRVRELASSSRGRG